MDLFDVDEDWGLEGLEAAVQGFQPQRMEPGPMALERAPKAGSPPMSLLDRLSLGLARAQWPTLGPHSSPLEKAIVGLGSFGKGLLATRAQTVAKRAAEVEDMNRGLREDARLRNRMNEQFKGANDRERRRLVIASAAKSAAAAAERKRFEETHSETTLTNGKKGWVPNSSLAKAPKEPKPKEPRVNLSIPPAARMAVDASEAGLKAARDAYRLRYWTTQFTNPKTKRFDRDSFGIYQSQPVPMSEVPKMLQDPEVVSAMGALRRSRKSMVMLMAKDAQTEDQLDEILALLESWEADTPGITAEVKASLGAPRK